MKASYGPVRSTINPAQLQAWAPAPQLCQGKNEFFSKINSEVVNLSTTLQCHVPITVNAGPQSPYTRGGASASAIVSVVIQPEIHKQ